MWKSANESPIISSKRTILLLGRGGALDGAERQLCHLAKNLDRARYEAVVLLDRGGPMLEELREGGVEAHVVSMRPWRVFGNYWTRFLDAWRIVRMARERGVALVHASDLWKSGYADFVGRKLRVPRVVHVRGPISRRDIEKHRLLDADVLVTIAVRYQEDLARAGARAQQLSQVDDAVDLGRFRVGASGGEDYRKAWAEAGQLVVGIAGRIEPFKRVLEFLEAAAVAEGRLPGRAKYVVIGEHVSPEYSKLVSERIERLGLKDAVVLAGRQSEMPAVMSALDVLVTMSGGSIMFEAMASGKALLSVREDVRSSVHTLHDRTALCVTTKEAGPAAAELVRLLTDDALRRRLGAAARAHVERHLSIEKMVAEMQAVYDRLLSGRG